MAEKMTIIHDERGEPAFAVLPWAEYRRLATAPGRKNSRSDRGEVAVFKRALAARPIGGDAFDIGLAEAGAQFKVRETRARDRAARRAGTPVEYAPMEVMTALIGGDLPLKAWRDYARLTQQQLASKAGVSRAYLAQLESGARVGKIDVLAKLAAALGCLVDDLISDDAKKGTRKREV